MAVDTSGAEESESMFTEAATTKLDAILVETTEGGERSRKQRHADMIRACDLQQKYENYS